MSDWAVPSSGGKGGSVGSWIIPTSFPPSTEQMKRMMMPNRFPPGKHSFPVMVQTTPNSRANKHTASRCDIPLRFSVTGHIYTVLLVR